ncbi:MAG TPA: hypothetical protein DCQ90_07140 [Erysipelotrichaceae bacterium]|nr:hypothetical protein [Erysipelotrichaceae bacterium]
MNLNELRTNCAISQKKGLHFILASVLIWVAIFAVQLMPIDILSKNFYTFCLTAPLLPLAYIVSKFIKVDFSDNTNPLNQLGILFSVNQMLYLLIVIWIYPTIPDKMLMVLTMIFGAHLLPYSWLYQSKSYLVMSVIIPVLMLILGNLYDGTVIAGTMILIETLFCGLLALENRGLSKKT